MQKKEVGAVVEGGTQDDFFGDKEKFEAALKKSNPLEALRGLAIELSNSGLKRAEVYNRFNEFLKHLRTIDKEEEENILGDVMDMIVDEYPPFNLNLPK